MTNRISLTSLDLQVTCFGLYDKTHLDKSLPSKISAASLEIEFSTLQNAVYVIFFLCAVFNIRVKQQQKGKENESKQSIHHRDA